MPSEIKKITSWTRLDGQVRPIPHEALQSPVVSPSWVSANGRSPQTTRTARSGWPPQHGGTRHESRQQEYGRP